MNINRCLYSRSNVARLYVPKETRWTKFNQHRRVCGEREKSLQNYLMNNEEPFLKMTLAEKVLDEKEDLEAYEKRITEEGNKSWYMECTLNRQKKEWMKTRGDG